MRNKQSSSSVDMGNRIPKKEKIMIDVNNASDAISLNSGIRLHENIIFEAYSSTMQTTIYNNTLHEDKKRMRENLDMTT